VQYMHGNSRPDLFQAYSCHEHYFAEKGLHELVALSGMPNLSCNTRFHTMDVFQGQKRMPGLDDTITIAA